VWAAIALSFGLAMDATAVSAARALAPTARRELAILPLVFGGFQSAMAALGWLGGASIGPYIEGWDRRVACALLCGIGLKMIVDAIRSNDEPHAAGTLLVYLGLGIATSIDAAAAGLTLPLLPVAPWLSLVLIGGITAGCSAVGHLAGRALGHRFGGHLGILGGLVLIAIGIDLLIGGI
jgi:manganese efflux pump family protein